MADKDKDLLTSQEEAFYRELEHTFGTAGWVRLTIGWKEERDAIPQNAFLNAKTMEDLEAARVRYELLTSLIDLPSHHTMFRLELIRERTHGETDPL